MYNNSGNIFALEGWQSDMAFFKKNPNRTYRLRRAFSGEDRHTPYLSYSHYIMAQSLIRYTFVRRAYPGVNIRLSMYFQKPWEDSELLAHTIFELILELPTKKNTQSIQPEEISLKMQEVAIKINNGIDERSEIKRILSLINFQQVGM